MDYNAVAERAKPARESEQADDPTQAES